MGLTLEQVVARHNAIGSSDAAAAIGLNPYRTAVELWQEKRGLAPSFEGNEATRWGTLLEPAVRQEYAERTGRVVRLPTETLKHPRFEFLVCHPDGVTDDQRLYEGKTARYPDGWGEPGTDQVPEHYLIQVQHALMITALPVADIAVLIGGQDFRLYEIPADAELQESIREAECEFWSHVTSGIRPQIDYTAPGVIAVLRKLYPGTNGLTVHATEEMVTYRMRFEAAKAAGRAAEEEETQMKARLLDFMGEAALLSFPDGRALRRARVERKGYTVAPTAFVDARWVNLK